MSHLVKLSWVVVLLAFAQVSFAGCPCQGDLTPEEQQQLEAEENNALNQ